MKKTTFLRFYSDVAYYPYGGVIPDLGNPTGGQPYKFGGKELITANGLNEYDFGARRYYQAVPHFTSIDRRCEKYYWLSPYLYCANNPVNLVDRNGNDIWSLDSEGRLINSQSFDGFDGKTGADWDSAPEEAGTLLMMQS